MAEIGLQFERDNRPEDLFRKLKDARNPLAPIDRIPPGDPFSNIHVRLGVPHGGGTGLGGGLVPVGPANSWGGEPWGAVLPGTVLMGKPSEEFVKKHGKKHG